MEVLSSNSFAFVGSTVALQLIDYLSINPSFFLNCIVVRLGMNFPVISSFSSGKRELTLLWIPLLFPLFMNIAYSASSASLNAYFYAL